MADERRRVALVTGSATGIGRASAILFAERGLDVCVNYSRSEADAKETVQAVARRGAKALLVRANVADDRAVRSMVERCQSELGGLDVLVNNAATTHFVAHRKLEALTESMWDEILAVNLKGAFFCCRASAPLLQERRGSIVNIASVAGVSGTGSSIAYAASKGGLITMTKSLAAALAPEIRVNAVCPGPVTTRWLKDHQPMVDAAVAITPLKRPSTPKDIAQVAVFLALDAGMMTGQALLVDGGRTI